MRAVSGEGSGVSGGPHRALVRVHPRLARSPRSGFALFTVLWLIVALSAITTAALVTARSGRWTTANRIALRRGRWAADGCLEILLGRVKEGAPLPTLDSVDLGGGTWCRVRLDDPESRVNVNSAPDAAIAAVLGSDTLAAAVLDWRDPDDAPRDGGAERDWYVLHGRQPPRNGPLASIDELRLVRGFDSAAVVRAKALLTVRGPGHIDVNTALAPVLATLPGFTPFVVDNVLERRAGGGSFSDLDALVYAIPTSARTELLAHYAELRQATVFTPELVVAHVEGHAPESGAVAQELVTLVPAGSRLAVVRREVW